MRATRHFSILASSLLSVAILLPSARAGYVFTNLDVPNVAVGSTSPIGINNAGKVVGNYNDLKGTNHGFIYSGGIYTTLDVPASPSGDFLVQAISNTGVVAGVFGDRTGSHGFLYSGGTYTTLVGPAPAFGNASAYGVNSSGTAAGTYFDAIGNGSHGFVYANGIYTTIDSPATNPGNTAVYGINDFGAVVGNYYDKNFLAPVFLHGYVRSGGVYTTIDAPVGNQITLTGINNSGTIIGSASGSALPYYNFLYSGGTFTQIVNPAAAPGTTLGLGINDAGALVGTYTDSKGVMHGFLATPSAVPEPSSLALCGIAGLVVFGYARARREIVTA